MNIQNELNHLSVSGSRSAFDTESPIAVLGLDENKLEASLNDLLSTSDGREAALRLTGGTARAFLDILQDVIELEVKRRPLLPNSQYCFRKLSEVSGMLTNSLFLDDVQRLGEHAVSGGGFADIWQGMYRGSMVALKVLRFFGTDMPRLQNKFCREALAWRQLHHPNVAPFYGVCTGLFSPHMGMVSPWMSNGNVLDYLKMNPDHDRGDLLYGVAQGIYYLHSLQPMLVHGDLRGANILITDDRRPVLADFGLATVAESQSITMGTASATGVGGSCRWMAPELFSPSMVGAGTYHRGPPSDVYAFGCLSLELYTGKPPFPTHYLDATIMMEVIQGIRPERPTEDVQIPQDMWALMQMCWAQTPLDRPVMAQVAKRLKYIAYGLELTPMDVSNEGSIRSHNSHISTELEFINMRTGPIHVYWLNFDGQRVSYKSVPPGGSTIMNTYMTHPWLLTDEAGGNALGIWKPEETYARVVLR